MIIKDEAAEKGVLGACLVGALGGGKTLPIDTAMDAGCDVSWFSLAKHRLLWEAMVAVHTDGKPVDMVTVGTLTKDYDFINELVDSTPTIQNLPSYLETTERCSKLRKVDGISRDTQEAVSREDADVSQIIAQASEALTTLTCAREEVSVDSAIDDNLIVLNNSYNGIVSGLPLPWTKFSNHVGGIQRASVCPLVGRDGKGKSGALCQMLDFWADQRVPTLCFSMEDVARRTVLRMAGCRHWFSAMSVEKGKVLCDGRWQDMAHFEKQKLEQQLEAYRDWLKDRPFWIDDNKYTVEELCAKIRHYHRVHGIQAVTIDGFKDIVHSEGTNETSCEKHIAQELFRVAKDCNLAMPVVSHITKIDDGIPIKKENIKGSGTQFQGARQVLIFQDSGIAQIAEEGTDFIMSCSKNNYGSGGSVLLRRDENVLSYQEM